jgi:aminoglycoside phosphotransferase (APT) family kinase protein
MRERWTRTTPVLKVDPEEAEALINPAIADCRAIRVEPLGGGHSNTNLRVHLDGAPSSVVLRLYQRDPTQAAKEAAIGALVAATVPVPRYFHLGERPSNGQTYAVVEWVEGQPLFLVAKKADEDELRAMGHSVGAVLAAIHAHTFAQAGFLDANLKITPFPGSTSLGAYLEYSFRGIARERAGDELADAAIAFARRNEHRQDVWNHPARLTHFDFGGTNILMRSDASVAGVVDWEFAASASPAPDFGNLLRPPLGRSSDFVRGVETGYRDAGGSLPADWLELTRLADIAAWTQFLTRPNVSAEVVQDALNVLRDITSETR